MSRFRRSRRKQTRKPGSDPVQKHLLQKLLKMRLLHGEKLQKVFDTGEPLQRCQASGTVLKPGRLAVMLYGRHRFYTIKLALRY